FEYLKHSARKTSKIKALKKVKHILPLKQLIPFNKKLYPSLCSHSGIYYNADEKRVPIAEAVSKVKLRPASFHTVLYT
ncbi:MAG TPA: hypothetical protein VF540_00910, partial [Segetibacter sp.]